MIDGQEEMAAATVLLVDDDEPLRGSLADILAVEGIATITAGSGQMALDLFSAVRPAVVVIDYHLPDSSGVDLAHAIKQTSSETPVLLLTGFASLETATAAVGKLDGYLLKPVEPSAFLGAVQEALARKALAAENRRQLERLKRVNAYQALHDHVTGLPNRVLLNERLEQALAGCRRSRRPVAVLFIDVDGFKVVNDLFGHQAGDELLREMARRLQESVRPSGTVARFGGDDFVVVHHGVETSADACLLAARLIDDLSKPVTVEGTEQSLSASVGIALALPGSPPPSAATMLRNADTAMYRAKEAGRGRWELFDDTMREQVSERFELERGLRRSLERGGFLLEYQPIVQLQSSFVVGAEALIRWERPGYGRQMPAGFLGAAESSGLIGPIGLWVLDEALSELARWQGAGALPDPFCLWVNVAPQQLANPDFALLVEQRLDRYGIAPELLGLEILEEGLLDVAATESVLTPLRRIGVAINLDDFGAGHSNLSLLQELPITGLKIDRRFITGLGGSSDDSGRAIVSGLVNLGHSLGLTVVAEGVETEVQASAVQAIGCELAQGYFYGRPGPADQLWPIVEPA